MAVTPDSTAWVLAVRGSHDRFVALVTPLDGPAVEGPSYAAEWSIAQVASHLGSQAEIFGMYLDAGLGGQDAPGVERFQPVWDLWNARTPAAQVADSVRANEELVLRLENLSDADRAAFALSMFGRDLDLAGLAAMRLSEHAVHTWDVATALDPAAEVAPDAVDLLVDNLPTTARWAGKPAGDARALVVETTAPRRRFVLTTGPEVALAAAGNSDTGDENAADADLRLPAEAFIRLVFGRLDPEHTPEDITGVTLLPQLRQVFAGF